VRPGRIGVDWSVQNWSDDMAVTAHRAIDHVKATTASEATRAAARPNTHEVLSFSQEYQELGAQKRAIESQMQAFCSAAMLKEQQRIRQSGGDTLTKWVNRKADMMKRRAALIEEMTLLTSRMTAIKVRAMDERRARNEATDPNREKFDSILTELRAIRMLMERALAMQQKRG
jgi:hypothetical protein